MIAPATTEQQVVMHSWCIQDDWRAPTIVGGSGARFWDSAGRSYIDMSSLSECCNLGHQHPSVVAAIHLQASRLCFVTSEWGAEPRHRLAEQLLEVSGFQGGRVFFTLAGADANEHAVKFARWASGKAHGAVLARDRSYHGASLATMNYSGDARGNAYPSFERVVRVAPPLCYRCPFGRSGPDDCARECEQEVGDAIARIGASGIAAVLMEAHAGSNGVVAPGSYWPALRATCRRHDVYLIADEVMAGFGRTGQWFGWQNFGHDNRPDMMTLAKGLTGAHLPLGAVVVSEAVNRKLERRMLYTGMTYSGHPLSCAAGLAAVQAYAEEGLIERAASLGAHMHATLEAMRQRHPLVGDVRGSGLFAVVELVTDRETRQPLVAWGDNHPGLRQLVQKARELGVSFAVRSNLILIAPPLVIGEDDLADALGVLDRLLDELESNLASSTSGEAAACAPRTLPAPQPETSPRP